VSTLTMGTAAYAAELRGLVTTGMEQYPVQGARISIDGQDITSEADGTFRVPNLDAGIYPVRVSYIGAEPILRDITVVDGLAPVQTFRFDETVSMVIAVGQRANLLSSINRKRAAKNLVEVVTSDAIGQFADQNVTEAARRVPGVSVENDQGEGRFIVIRGVDPNLNTTSINGVRIPSAEGDARGAALDVIDSEVLESIEVTKSLTPDLDGDGIGGNIEIKTISAFNRDGAYLRAKAAGSYNDQVDAWSPKLSVSASNIFANDTLGVAVTGSYRDRRFGSDNREVDGGFISGDLEGEALFPEELEFRDYEINRERINLAANIDYRPESFFGGEHEFYLRTLYSQFTDNEYRLRREVKLDEDDEPVRRGNVFTFAEGEVDRDTKDRLEEQVIWSASVGGVSTLDDWVVDYSAAYTTASEDEPDRLDVDFRTGGGAFNADITDPLNPRIGFIDPAYTNPAAFGFDGAELVNGKTEDDEAAFELNLQRNMDFGEATGFVKFGGKARLRSKSRDVDLIAYDDSDLLSLADVQTGVDYSLGDFGPGVDRDAVRAAFESNLGSFDIKADDTFLESSLADYDASEDIYAGYLMASVDWDRLTLIGGVRVEHTDYEGEGRDVRLFEEDGVLSTASLPLNAECQDSDGGAFSAVDGTVLSDDIICVGDAFNADSYTEILPSVVARFEASDNVVLRASYYKSLARPNFGAIVPAANVESNDDNEFEGTFGNITALGIPRLRNQTADSYDLGIEIYTDNGGLFSAGVFHKEFDDFITLFEDENFSTSFADFEEAFYSINLPRAELTGWEVNVQQALTFLPEGLDGFLVAANYTSIDGEAEALDGTELPLPKQSDEIANVALGYDKYGVDIRVAYAYRSEYLDTVGGRFVDEHGQWDITGKYRINDQFRLFGEITNLTDEPFVAFDEEGGRRVLNQFDVYGPTYEIGLQYQF